MSLRTLLAGAAPMILLAGCGQSETPNANDQAQTENAVQSLDEKLSNWFDDYYEAQVARSPEQQTFLGRKTNYDQWTNSSDEYALEGFELRQAALAELKATFDYDALSEPSQLSYDIFVYQRELGAERIDFRNHWYEFHQFRAPHSSMPAFMINQHRVGSVSDAEAYIARLRGFGAKMDQHIAIAEKQVADGISPPDWSYPQMIETSRNIVSGAPFDDGEPSALFSDIQGKVARLDIEASEKERLLAEAESALVEVSNPPMRALLRCLNGTRPALQGTTAFGSCPMERPITPCS
ncbi:MAG: DUF885 family protein [Pseudomonadota bacterium]